MNETPQIPGLPQRSHPIHQPLFEDGNRSLIIFATICTKDRRRLLANPECHLALHTAWQAAAHWLVGRYVIMPDHLHLFCAPNTNPLTALSGWIRYWKTATAKSIGASAGTLWQPDFWDTQLRGHESYAQKWDYVRHNPVRAGLVNVPEAWPYQGELNILRWHR
jgi:putative transposase